MSSTERKSPMGVTVILPTGEKAKDFKGSIG